MKPPTRNETLKVQIWRTHRTQRVLAHETGIKPARISDIVNGWARPTQSERRRIAQALGCSEADLFATTASDHPAKSESEPGSVKTKGVV